MDDMHSQVPLPPHTMENPIDFPALNNRLLELLKLVHNLPMYLFLPFNSPPLHTLCISKLIVHNFPVNGQYIFVNSS